jgi:hypothetical protein
VVTRADESVRSVLYGLCIFGIWLPYPLWLIGAIITTVRLSDAPSSHAKRAMTAMIVLGSIWIVPYIGGIIAAIISALGCGFAGGGRSCTAVTLEAVSITLTVFWILWMLLFTLFADMTFLSTHTDASPARKARGWNLFANLSGLFVFPLFALFGVPLAVWKFRQVGASQSHKTTQLALGIVAWLLLLVTWFTVIGTSSTYVYIQQSPESGGRLECNNAFVPEGFKRAVLQDTPSNLTTTVLETTMLETTSNATTTIFDSTTFPMTSPFFAATTTTNFWEEQQTTCVFVPLLSSEPVFSYRIPSILFFFPDGLAVLVLMLLWIPFHLAFLIFTDIAILSVIGREAPHAGGVIISSAPVRQDVVTPCPSCSAPLSWTPTGAKTQVQCYKCQAVVEFGMQQPAPQVATAPMTIVQ